MPKAKQNQGFFDLETLLLLAILLFAAVFFSETIKMPFISGIFPNIVATAIGLLSAYSLAGKLFQAVRVKRAAAAAGGPPPVKAKASPVAGIAWWWSLAAMLGYYLLTLLVGLLWSTLIYTLAMPVVMRYRRWSTVVLVGVVMTAVLYYAFGSFLSITMPEGLLFGG